MKRHDVEFVHRCLCAAAIVAVSASDAVRHSSTPVQRQARLHRRLGSPTRRGHLRDVKGRARPEVKAAAAWSAASSRSLPPARPNGTRTTSRRPTTMAHTASRGASCAPTTHCIRTPTSTIRTVSRSSGNRTTAFTSCRPTGASFPRTWSPHGWERRWAAGTVTRSSFRPPASTAAPGSIPRSTRTAMR